MMRAGTKPEIVVVSGVSIRKALVHEVFIGHVAQLLPPNCEKLDLLSGQTMNVCQLLRIAELSKLVRD
jgi:hypothetical protein